MSPRTLPLLVVAAGASFAPTARADLLVVNSNADSGAGTLRAALLAAERTPGADRIRFALPSGKRRIALKTALPAQAGSIDLDARTQPGWNGAPIVELDGSLIVPAGPALVLRGDGSSVRGLVIHGFRDGVVFHGSRGGIVAGCWLGLDASGLAAPGIDSAGVRILASSDNRIGGADALDRNVISGCDDGVAILGAGSSRNVVAGNWIGLDAEGVYPLANSVGVRVDSRRAIGNVIGGAGALRNVITGNLLAGIELGRASDGTRVRGNWIGLDPSGSFAVGNSCGVLMEGRNDVVGGTRLEDANWIAGCDQGVSIHGGTGNSVVGNRLGTDVESRVALPNAIGIELTGTRDAVVRDNVVANSITCGVSIGGSHAVAFRWNAIVVGGCDGLVSREDDFGLDATDNVVSANARNGVVLFGRQALVARNEILLNLGAGIVVATGWGGEPGHADALRFNSIHSNGGLAIDLGGDEQLPGDGPTANDRVDRDAGANGLQNFPELTDAATSSGMTAVRGRLESVPGMVYAIDFFSSAAPDADGRGEARLFLATRQVKSDVNGVADFQFALPDKVRVGGWISATATNLLTLNTSEIGPPIQVEKAPK